MRLAQQKTDRRLTAKADKMISDNLDAKSIGKISLRCGDGTLRSRWMDLYVEHGGVVNEVCGERIGPLAADTVVAQIADQLFYANNPRLRGRKLTLSHKDRSLRSEWMDLYVQYGGAVVVVCDPDKEVCLGMGKAKKKA